jgi:outer membrane receptor protein involved in Fe transport
MTAFHRRWLSLVTAGILAQALYGGATFAQSPGETAGSEGISEIVVTATRREERLQDVPVSITAFTQEQMDAQGLRSIDDVTRLTPGVSFQRMGMSLSANYNDENSDINIRGVDSQAGTSTTGIYIDDTPIQTRHIGFGSVNPFPALFDVDRVEVLRGPQGTLFGAGAEGGAVRFISPEPGLAGNSGYLRGESSYTQDATANYNVGAAAGGPIIDNVLGFRVSVSFGRDGGYVDRVSYSHPGVDPLTAPNYTGTTEKNSDWQETRTVRAALKWAVNEQVSITPSIYYQELQINDTAAYWINLSTPGSDVFRNGNALTNPSTDPFWLAAVKLDWNLGVAALTSNTSYFSRDQHSVSDYTQYWRATFLGNSYPQAGDAGPAPFGDKQSNFYQEIRLASTNTTARLVWNAGVFYSTYDRKCSGKHLRSDPGCGIYRVNRGLSAMWSSRRQRLGCSVPQRYIVDLASRQVCGSASRAVRRNEL